jgi:hypothetical protein
MKSICYWCGEAETTQDHVPAKCFYPPDMRNNLLKVPACEKHNTEMSKLDERFRLYLQAASDSEVALNHFRDKTYPRISRPESKGFVKSLSEAAFPARLNGETTIAFAIEPALQDTFFEKVIRGLYFLHYDTPFDGEVFSACTHLVRPGVDYKELIQMIVSFEKDFIPGKTTDDRVFKYKYARVFDQGREAYALHGVFYGQINLFGFGIGAEKTAVQ